MLISATPAPNTADNVWVLISTALVLMMCIPGLFLFYGGLVRGKNVLSVAAQCLAAGSTVLAFAAWYWALSRGGITRIGALQFLQPIVTLACAVALLSEPLTPRILVATLLILAGVALTQRRRRLLG